MRKTLKTGIAFLLCMAAAVPAGTGRNRPIQVGDRIPGFYLKHVDGGRFFLKDHIGEGAKFRHKALIFSLCASYCKPCKKEIPELGKMKEKYGDKGLGIFLIAIERKENARKLIEETGTTLPVLIDRYLLVPKLIGRTGIPCTLLVDGEGIVRYVNTGFNEENAGEFIKKFENAVALVLESGGADSDERPGKPER